MKITEQTSVEEIVAKYPGMTKVFIDFGLPCLVCGEPFWGTVEELARQNNVDLKSLIKALNKKKEEFDEKI
ncbi:MAG TPA: DUF1858 domain-containing protein [candidate division WOR-3 bacterium]|uniref:DUF1858 domain-containing protein n=1 Tax=candidate division WOR-3 bacterium TaxID=2052148 RepID=A0A9C9EQ03_UNCW3|nr:DUF1858 domain-containing protein [candidate division WOR-3 bacterium]